MKVQWTRRFFFALNALNNAVCVTGIGMCFYRPSPWSLVAGIGVFLACLHALPLLDWKRYAKSTVEPTD